MRSQPPIAATLLKVGKNWQQAAWAWIQGQLRDTHGAIVLLGLFIGLCYLPSWVAGLFNPSHQDNDGFTLAICFVGIGLYQLWKDWANFSQGTVSEEDRLMGHALVIAGIFLFPFCHFAIWAQSLVWGLILTGIAFSCWGLQFFSQNKLTVALLALSLYPNPALPAALIWQAITPYKYLEQIMANAGAWGLQLIGQNAIADQALVIFPGAGAVDVEWGCNGFDMSLTMVAAGLIMGIFLKQSWQKIVGFMAIGVIVSLIFNVPRVMLLAMASVHWGHESFEFWHGPWGGQLFSTVLFTAYYYLVMWMAKQKPAATSVVVPSE